MKEFRILINSMWVMGKINCEEKMKAEILLSYLERV